MRWLISLFALTFFIPAFSQTGMVDFFAEGKKAADAKNFALAIENYKKAIAQKPADGESWYEIGWCYNEMEKYEDAVKALANAKIYLTNQPRVFFESGYSNEFSGRTDDAIADYKKCIELDQHYASAYRYLANIYNEIKKDYVTASSYYNQCINYSRESEISAKTWYRKGFCENESGQYEDAVSSLQRAITTDNKYTDAWNELGYAYFKLGKAGEAIQAYSTCKTIDTKNTMACSGIGDVYRYLRKDVDSAMKSYTEGITINPKSAGNNFGLGWCYDEKGNYEAAISYLKKAIELNNKYAVAYTELGYAYYSLKRYDEALAELNTSVSLVNASAANYYMGLCYVAKKLKAKAQEIYQRLVDLNTTDAGNLLDKINAM
jgi:superkiller protein 3